MMDEFIRVQSPCVEDFNWVAKGSNIVIFSGAGMVQLRGIGMGTFSTQFGCLAS